MTTRFRDTGILVGNGYIVPPPDKDALWAYTTLYTCAEAGDTEAVRIITSLPIGAYDVAYIAADTGVRMGLVTASDIVLTHAHFPPSFIGKGFARLQTRADEGSLAARRALAHITRLRLHDAGFHLKDNC